MANPSQQISAHAWMRVTASRGKCLVLARKTRQVVVAIRRSDRQRQVPYAMNECDPTMIPSWPLANRRPLDRRNRRDNQVAALDEFHTCLAQERGNFPGALKPPLHWTLARLEVVKVSTPLPNRSATWSDRVAQSCSTCRWPNTLADECEVVLALVIQVRA